MTLHNKIVVITGAGKGIGRATAIAFSEKGAFVVIAEKDTALGEETCALINQSGNKAKFISTDVSKLDSILSLVTEIETTLGSIDILINNAGFGIWKSPYDLTLEDWDAVNHTNLRGTFFMSREVAKIMRKHGGGKIINLASTRAHMSEANFDAYAATKGGIVALTHSLAISFSEDNIQVNCISPGWIENENWEGLSERDHLQHPSKRVGKPEDIAEACLYLTGNPFITGTELVIDGGMTRKMIYED